MKLKTTIMLTAMAVAPFSIISCDSDNEPSSTDTTVVVRDTQIFSTAPISSSNQRVVLAGSLSGDTAIAGNFTPRVRINGTVIENMILEDEGRIIVDVPRGSNLQVDFDAPSENQISSVGEVYCFYPDDSGDTIAELVFPGGTASAPGIPAYICPLDVASDGGVTLAVLDSTLEGRTFRYDVVETISEVHSGDVNGTIQATMRYEGTVTFGASDASFSAETQTLLSYSGTGDLTSRLPFRGFNVGQSRTNPASTESYSFNATSGRLNFEGDEPEEFFVLNFSGQTIASPSFSQTFQFSGTTVEETDSEVGTWIEEDQ